MTDPLPNDLRVVDGAHSTETPAALGLGATGLRAMQKPQQHRVRLSRASIPAGSFVPPPWDAANSAPHGATYYADLPDYEALVHAVQRKRLERNVSYKTLAEAASLEPGFVSGAMGPSGTRRFGWLSVFLMLPVLKLRLVLLDDPSMPEYELEPRHANQARPNNYSSQPGTRTMLRVFKHIAKNGGKARMRKMTKAERCEHQSRASNARWRKFRRKRKAWRGDDCPHLPAPSP